MSGQELDGPNESMHKEIKNNNKQPLLSPDEDANANRIPKVERQTEGGKLPPLQLSQSSTQERIIIWGTHSRSKDPELEEFELLECQEFDTFLKEQNDSKRRAKKDPCQRQAALSSLDPARPDKNANHRTEMDLDQSTQPLDLRTSASRSESRRSLKDGRSNSENNVFVSTFSVVSSLSGSLSSSLDSAGRTESPSFQFSKPTSDKCRFQQPATVKSICLNEQTREQPRNVNLNHNSTILPQDPGDSNCPTDRQSLSAEGQGNGLFTKFQRNIERVPPSCRQLVHPLSPGIDKRFTSGYQGQNNAHQRLSRSLDTGPKTSQQIDSKNPSENNSNTQSFSSGLRIQPSESSTKVGSILRRQGSAENAASALERKSHLSRRAYSSPTRSSTPPSPKNKGSPQRHPPMSPVKTRVATRGPQLGYGASHGYSLRPPVKTTVNMNVQNPVPQLSSAATSPPKCPPKPKSVRPKIITYIRKSPQVNPQSADGHYEVSSLPTRLSASTSLPNSKPSAAEPPEAPVQSASNLLYDKYRQDLQKTCVLSPELMVSGIKPPSHNIIHKATSRTNSFCGFLANNYLPAGTDRFTATLGPAASGAKHPPEAQMLTQETGGYFQPPRSLRPQLGVGAVNRAPPTAPKSRIFTGQKSPLAISQPVQAVSPSTTAQATPPTTSSVTPFTHSPPESLDHKKPPAAGLTAKSLLPKPASSGLRPPGYSRLPPPRLAAFGFVRSSSVSSVTSNQSVESTRSDPCRPVYRPASEGDDPPFHRVITASCGDGPKVMCRSSPQPPSTPVPTRRPLLPPPSGSPVGTRKEFQKNSDGSHSALSSPKRLAVVSPKPQSPVLQRQRAAAAATRVPAVPGVPGVPGKGHSGSPGLKKKKEEEQRKEKEREEEERLEEEVQQLQTQCKEQNRQLLALRSELKRTVLGLDTLAICTQHFCLQSESTEQKERHLSLELTKVQEEQDLTAARWELLQQEKVELEESFELQLRELQEQQESELLTLEEQLRARHASDTDHLKAEHQSHVEELRTQQQEQIEELTAQHESTLEDLRTMHNMTMASQQEEHARTMRDLRKAHEQQKAILDDDFEKQRISLQDQVDTMTFQNRALRDKAKRFEEALRKSADEQIMDALAPYQHIEQDLKSLKEVLEMKNQQIHEQERKICHLEKMQAQKNGYLEERVQVLQQQNEDLKARIDRNTVLSRQLSEENANLHGHVERESNEKKRLSRNNEELLWLLQTSPNMSPSSSPSHRVFFPGHEIPPYTCSPGPETPTHSHSYSPGPCTPSYMVGSPGPGTPTHRGSGAARCSPGHVPNANTLPR
ncbi:microtubule-associated tumor suppressor candidate 2 [Trichomycterus rosablanca]|uniref:microtubule-associated tumor suppressor candidate 2 n=1 Tax=Trichomycterus rosablanca TaxID=2290929 RepID=UPI002F35B6E8